MIKDINEILITRCNIRNDQIIMVGSYLCKKCENYIKHQNSFPNKGDFIFCKFNNDIKKFKKG